MRIISHRGYWQHKSERNQPVAFERSFNLGFGTETDVRDCLENLVISHDIPDQSTQTLIAFLDQYTKINSNLTLAINIKADGLQTQLKQHILDYNLKHYFVFDMSIPDMLYYHQQGINVFTRQSEYELQPACYHAAKGIWLDCFQEIWYDQNLIKNHISANKQIAFVSPELHHRKPESLWEMLRKNDLHRQEGLILCTDIPEAATAYFS